MKILLRHGANVNARCGDALQAACHEGHENIVKILLQHGADINAYGGYYETALQAAYFGCHDKIMHMLLVQGANLHAHLDAHGSECGQFRPTFRFLSKGWVVP